MIPQPPTRAGVVALSKAFGAHSVLLGVTVEFASDRCTFIAGPSGTGKSVLARHLVGLLRPDEGQVYYRDVRVDTMTDADLYQIRRKCVYVFQHPTLFDSMSVIENVSLVVRHQFGLGKRSADERARGYLERLGLGDCAEVLPVHLSQGQQKMVSIARALALEPETLILDEPTTGLDPLAALQLDNLVATMRSGGVTLLIISHDLRSIRRLADRVVFLHRGAVRFEGAASGFFSSSDPVVHGFVSSDPETEM